MNATQDPLLTDAQTAALLNIKATTLQVWRCTKRVKIPFIRIGRCVRYRQSDIMQFIADSEVKK